MKSQHAQSAATQTPGRAVGFICLARPKRSLAAEKTNLVPSCLYSLASWRLARQERVSPAPFAPAPEGPHCGTCSSQKAGARADRKGCVLLASVR